MTDGKSHAQGQYISTTGDGYVERITAAAIDIPEACCPVRKLTASTKDGRQALAAWRQPPGEGPFPAVVFIRGGLRLRDFDVLRHNMLNNPVFTRFLALGYACGEATFRDYYENVQDPGPILDCLAIVEAVRETPAVHRESVVLFGGSGGGSIALELAGMTHLAAFRWACRFLFYFGRSRLPKGSVFFDADLARLLFPSISQAHLDRPRTGDDGFFTL
jgi:dipeptidyl aminopeptidase/acylaminoacyl peptidase